MSTLLRKQLRVNRIVTTSIEQAKALEDPSRLRIVELLYRSALNAEQIAGHLKRSGRPRALTTVRHHLDVLREAGLVEVARIEEARGAVTKYYGTTTRLLGFNAPDDFDSRYSSAIRAASAQIEDVLKSIAPKVTIAPKAKKKPDPRYSQYVMVEIVNRAVARAMERGAGDKG